MYWITNNPEVLLTNDTLTCKATLGGGTRSRPIKYISNCNLVNNGFSFEDIKGVPLNGDSCSSEEDCTF